MAKEYVKQHIVPKRYLERFTFKNEYGAPVVGVVLKNTKGIKPFTRSIKDVGYEKNIYDVEDKNDPKYWEHFLDREFDILCGSKLQNIIARINLTGSNYKLNSDEIDTLTKLMLSQAFRVPESINYIEQIYKEELAPFTDWYISKFPKNQKQEIKKVLSGINYSNQWKKQVYLNAVFDKKGFEEKCDIIRNRVWIIYYNNISDKIPFCTSDNPVLIESLKNENTGLFNNGLASPTTLLYFPITPKIAVVNYPKEMFFGIETEFTGRLYFLNEEKYIITKNEKIVGNAFKHAFIPQPTFNELIELWNH